MKFLEYSCRQATGIHKKKLIVDKEIIFSCTKDQTRFGSKNKYNSHSNYHMYLIFFYLITEPNSASKYYSKY